MLDFTLEELAETVRGTLVLGDAAVREGISESTVVNGAVDTDSREIVPGGIFVAKPGEFTDGHLFAPQVVAAGAVLVIGQRVLDIDVPQIVVADSVEALGALATEVVARVRRLGSLRIVGITGSNGKTTTKNLIRTVLEQHGETVAPRGSYNNEVGAPLTMLKLTESTRYLVAEMGASGRGEIARLIRMARPDIGVVLKVGMAHAGEFGGIEVTAQTKAEMVRDLLPEDWAVLNIDDPRVSAMAAETRAQLCWFGLDARARFRAEDIRVHARGTEFTLVAGDERMPVRFRVLGEHHVMNALAATAVCSLLGVPLAEIVAALETVVVAERYRMEVSESSRGVTVINDAYNASPDSVAAGLRTLAQIAEGRRRVAVLGEMSELGEFSAEEHDRIGRLVVRLGIERLVVVGPGARSIHMAATMEGSWDGESVFAEDLDEAFEYLRDDLRDGDLVFVKSSNSARLRFLGDRVVEFLS